MGKLRLLHHNLIDHVEAVDNQQAGIPTTPIKSGANNATLESQGDYTDIEDRLYVIEIDGTAQGMAIDEATFKWSDDGGETWNETEIQTEIGPISLNYGISIKFLCDDPGGADLAEGDRWWFLAIAPFGAVKLFDHDRGSRYRSEDVSGAVNLTFDTGVSISKTRITETGDTRVTETGDTRVTEGE